MTSPNSRPGRWRKLVNFRVGLLPNREWRTRMHGSRRIGTFKVGRCAIEDGRGPLVYRDVVPFEVRYLFGFDGWEVTGHSEHFEEIGQGEMPKQYVIKWQFEDVVHDGKVVGQKEVGVTFRLLPDNMGPPSRFSRYQDA